MRILLNGHGVNDKRGPMVSFNGERGKPGFDRTWIEEMRFSGWLGRRADTVHTP